MRAVAKARTLMFYLRNSNYSGDMECAIKAQKALFASGLYGYYENMSKKECHCSNFMEEEDFVSTIKIKKEITNRKKGTNTKDEKINWLPTKEI
ncbi:hypothetical protein FQA39_LY09196 [Lamprigera yunnana]|nr:hypothetical protein FQA39_LY09196 [Lamprigera yunnana]